MDTRTDLQLLKAFTRGQEAAFAAIVDRHGAAVKSYAMKPIKPPSISVRLRMPKRMVCGNYRLWKPRLA